MIVDAMRVVRSNPAGGPACGLSGKAFLRHHFGCFIAILGRAGRETNPEPRGNLLVEEFSDTQAAVGVSPLEIAGVYRTGKTTVKPAPALCRRRRGSNRSERLVRHFEPLDNRREGAREDCRQFFRPARRDHLRDGFDGNRIPIGGKRGITRVEPSRHSIDPRESPQIGGFCLAQR